MSNLLLKFANNAVQTYALHGNLMFKKMVIPTNGNAGLGLQCVASDDEDQIFKVVQKMVAVPVSAKLR